MTVERLHDRKENPVPRVSAKRVRPRGGWVTDPIKSTQHGPNGVVAKNHRRIVADKAAKALVEMLKRGKK